MTDRVHSGSPYEARNGYCRARRVDGRILVAGTGPTPPDGEAVATTARGQFDRCAAIAVAAIEQLGGSVADVVRTRMYITDVADADEIGAAHRDVFGAAEPVATLVVVDALVVDTWRVEIEVEAAVV